MKVRFIGRTRVSKKPKFEVICPNHVMGSMREVHIGLEKALSVADHHVEQRHAIAFPDADMQWWQAVGQKITRVKVSKL